MEALTPNVAMAKAYLDALDPEAVFTFQTFADNSDSKDGRLSQVLHGTLEQHLPRLTQLQQRGAGVFVMVNEGNGVVYAGSKTCRTTKNVIRVRALWVDLDGSPLQPVLDAYSPDLVIESSPDRWHAYWLTHDCALADFRLRQQQIAARFKGDPTVCDLPRVMRLPGFWHQKNQPFMTCLVPAEVTQ